MSECKSGIDASGPQIVTLSPYFESNNGWSAGYEIATRDGNGAIVGPGGGNANIFAQQFSAEPGAQYKIKACAASIEPVTSKAVIQVNWTSTSNQYISTSRTTKTVDDAATAFSLSVQAPPEVASGTLYVVPGEPNNQVRYTEMSVARLDPIDDFASYKFWGVEGGYLALVAVLAPGLFWLFYALTKRDFELGRRLMLTVIDPKSRANSTVHRAFFVFGGLVSALALIVLEPAYEQHSDAGWHQTSVDTIFAWSTFSLDLKADILHNFGIQLPINPFLSPTFLVGSLADIGNRIPIQAAFQAVIMYLLLVATGRLAGGRLSDASAGSLVAVLFCWVPVLSDEAISHQATLGLLWQDIAIGVLIATLTFAVVGDPRFTKRQQIGSAIGFSMVVLWAYTAYPELTPFFTLTTAFLCLGVAAGIRSWAELRAKALLSVCLVGFMLVIGMPDFVLNIFGYTQQAYFESLQRSELVGHYFVVNSLLANADLVGGIKVYLFFLFAAVGGVVAYRFGNPFARKIALAALVFEVLILSSAALNAAWQAVPLAFTYVEVAGIPLVALFAGIGILSCIRALLSVCSWLGAKGWGWARSVYIETKHLALSEPLALLSALIVAVSAAALVYSLDTQEGYQVGFPPSYASEPSRLIERSLALAPGDEFVGRSLLLVNVGRDEAVRWWDNFVIRYFKYRQGLGNDLAVDLAQANVPSVNEYGHWTSPAMTSLMAVAFYRPGDPLERAARILRDFRPNLARLLGVSLVASDAQLDGMMELYSGSAGDHPLFLYRLDNSNLGQFSPTEIRVSSSAIEMVEHLRAPEFDGRLVAISEEAIEDPLVPASHVSIKFEKGPRLRVDATSAATSLVVLPFEFSHCLHLEGDATSRLMPVNLAQTGLLFHGEVSVDITYRYGLIAGTTCRDADIERVYQLDISGALEGEIVAGVQRPRE